MIIVLFFLKHIGSDACGFLYKSCKSHIGTLIQIFISHQIRRIKRYTVVMQFIISMVKGPVNIACTLICRSQCNYREQNCRHCPGFFAFHASKDNHPKQRQQNTGYPQIPIRQSGFRQKRSQSGQVNSYFTIREQIRCHPDRNASQQ